jgi:hypothetical protein
MPDHGVTGCPTFGPSSQKLPLHTLPPFPADQYGWYEAMTRSGCCAILRTDLRQQHRIFN